MQIWFPSVPIIMGSSLICRTGMPSLWLLPSFPKGFSLTPHKIWCFFLVPLRQRLRFDFHARIVDFTYRLEHGIMFPYKLICHSVHLFLEETCYLNSQHVPSFVHLWHVLLNTVFDFKNVLALMSHETRLTVNLHFRMVCLWLPYKHGFPCNFCCGVLVSAF